MRRGDCFVVRDGDISIPEGGYLCLWALQSLMPLLTPKERELAEEQDQDWMWRVHHAQCPDPKGRVVFKIDRVRKIAKGPRQNEGRPAQDGPQPPASDGWSEVKRVPGTPLDLRVVVEQVRGRCTSGMQPGDFFILRRGRLYIPHDRHFCLYALQAVLPFLMAKQRRLEDGDWLATEHHIICPDPAGNVVMRIQPEGPDRG